jgi:4-amino-4-deoxy-L-arabinose transferase-like glycosyltransferase
VPDDAYYYFVIARNLVSGFGSSFDGTTLTNGYHPLWLALLAPIFKFSQWLIPESADFPIHLALSLSALLDTLTVGLCFLITRRVTRSSALALLASVLYAFNPYILFQATNGLETALSNLTLAASVLAFMRLADNNPSTSELVLVGALLGATFLARTDNAIFIAMMLVFYVCSRKSIQRLVHATMMGIIAAVFAAPWLFWNLITFGNPIQTSGRAIPFLMHADLESAPLYLKLARSALGGIEMLLAMGNSSGLGWPLMAILYLALGSAAFLTARRRRDTAGGTSALTAEIWPIWAFAGSAFITLGIHACIRWSLRAWYPAPSVLATALLLGGVLPAFLSSRKRRLAGFPVVVTAAIMFTLFAHVRYSRGYYPWQIEMQETAYWLRDHSEAGTRIGAFNSGIYGYYAERPVINLDGVIDAGALEAIEARNLEAYITSRSLDVLADYSSYFEQYDSFMGAELESFTDLTAEQPGSLWGDNPILILTVDSLP